MKQLPEPLMNRAKRYSRLLIKKCWMPLAIFIICMAILFSLFRALTPWAKQYKGQVEHHLSTLLGQPVIISSMETSWYWFEPVLKLNDVSVSDSEDRVLKLNKLLVGINLLSSLWHWHLQPGVLYVDDVHLTLRQKNDHWDIDGLRSDKEPITLEPTAYLPVLSWLLAQQKIIIKNVSALIHLNDGSLLPVTALNVTAINNNGHYRLRGVAKLAQTTPTELLILADMKLNPYALRKINGQAYVAVHHFLPTQWQLFFPKSPYHVESGKGGVEIWLDMAKGEVTGLQTRINFKRLAWSKYGSPHAEFIQSLQANLAWNPTDKGWKLSGDHINLRAGGVEWPENTMLLNYNQSDQSYHFFINTLLLEPFLALSSEWPKMMQPMLAMHPHGQLYDTQIGIKQDRVDYLLSRFAGLSWDASRDYPGVDNASGVVQWQPSGGRLDLDGEKTTLLLKNKPSITFDTVNATFEWQSLSQGLRISMEHLVLNHPDLRVNARGVIDALFAPSANLQLAAEFSMGNAVKWMAYIPSRYLKPKLNHWLKHDIKRINNAEGQLAINGALADFPFDKAPGEFSVISHLSGVDLIFNKKWPLSQDIDAYLRVNKRTLEADVHHAIMHGVVVDQVNLRLDDMGLDKETLLIHGKVEAPAQKALGYVFVSPLREPLAKLKALDVEGTLGLDLRLEVPLYPENDDVLVKGALTFNHNQATFHHAWGDIEFRQLTGTLMFDEDGATNSELKALLLDDPVVMHVQSIKKPKPATELTIEGNTTLDALHKSFKLPIYPFVQGHLNLATTLTLTNDSNDFDNMKINTSLKGVGIDLPAPFGKASDESAPLAINVDFNPEKALRFRFNYDNRVSSDLWFTGKNNQFAFQKGDVEIGKGDAQLPKKEGLHVGGVLASLDVSKWQSLLPPLSSTGDAPAWLQQLQWIDLSFGNVLLWGKNYPKVVINANKLSKTAWSFHLDQQDVAGQFQYDFLSNTVSGHFNRLNIAKAVLLPSKGENETITLKPSYIPNLNLTIDTFKVGEIDFGTVGLKSTTKPNHWQLDYCNIKSPAFQLAMKGDWDQDGIQNNTKLQANLQIATLSDSLKMWHITPAVDAHHGEIQFDGAWPGPINGFSLEKVSGQLSLHFKDGRITHLSPETEGKLGLGKLLSVLSLQTIPRRLKLDFSDLSNDGYSFDVFKGNFTLKNGVMNTTDSYIDGPVAYASMKGDLDVVKQKYDVLLHISPHITASLPIVATIAGGPIAGIATWVASKIINKGMQTVTGYSYKISGPWLHPDVQQVSIFKKQPN